MSKERELLKRVRDALRVSKQTHYSLYWDIQTALDQPEQEPYLTELDREFLKEATTTLSKVAAAVKSKDTWNEYLHIMVGDAMGNIFDMMSDKGAPPTRELMTGKEISQGFRADKDATNAESYWAGVALAENHYGAKKK